MKTNPFQFKMSKSQNVMIAMRLLRNLATYELTDIEIRRNASGEIKGYQFYIHSLDVVRLGIIESALNNALFVLYPHVGIKDGEYLQAAII